MKDIRLVEVEIHSYCNRKCAWCPNQFIDRTEMKIMPEDMYFKILLDLKRAGYRGVISYSRYNEPMADIDLLKRRTETAKLLLPEVKLVTNTNGDYLSYEALNGLKIDELTIMDYDCAGMDICIERLKECHVKITKAEYPFIYGTFGNMKILYYVDWPMHARFEDRGGSLIEYSDERRKIPCYEPKHFIGIDYNGNVMPCCHMRSDNPKHKNYIQGSVLTSSLENIYNSPKAIAIREITSTMKITPIQIKLIGVDLKNLYYPCMYCTKNGGRYTRDNPSIDYL
jgi:MoaA/NifB/PqqE/SkfB family radical SAM enzyme